MIGTGTGVWFDLDGTLITYDDSFQTIFETAVGESDPGVFSVYSTALMEEVAGGVSAPYETAFRTAVAATPLSGDPATLTARYIDAELEASTLVPGAKTVVETAAAHGPIGVLTNGADRVQRRKIDRHDLDTVIDSVVVSGAYGVAKPDPALFGHADDSVPATTHVYVCDSVDDDVAGAHRAGWKAVLVTDNPRPTRDTRVEPPAWVVDDITQVRSVFQSTDHSSE